MIAKSSPCFKLSVEIKLKCFHCVDGGSQDRYFPLDSPPSKKTRKSTKSHHYERAQYVRELAFKNGVFPAPTDINIASSIPIVLAPLEWSNFHRPPRKIKITNAGHTVLLTAKWLTERPYLKSGPLKGCYVFSQLHFHWGEYDNTGSEHTINGASLPLEMHVVHFRSCFQSQEVALRQKDGIAMLVYLFKLQEKPNPDIQFLIDGLHQVFWPYASVNLDPKPLACLMKPFTKDYFLYWGSSETARCAHVYLWFISRLPIGISSQQLAQFRILLDSEGKPMMNNYREAQPNNMTCVFHVSPEGDCHNTLHPLGQPNEVLKHHRSCQVNGDQSSKQIIHHPNFMASYLLNKLMYYDIAIQMPLYQAMRRHYPSSDNIILPAVESRGILQLSKTNEQGSSNIKISAQNTSPSEYEYSCMTTDLSPVSDGLSSTATEFNIQNHVLGNMKKPNEKDSLTIMSYSNTNLNSISSSSGGLIPQQTEMLSAHTYLFEKKKKKRQQKIKQSFHKFTFISSTSEEECLHSINIKSYHPKYFVQKKLDDKSKSWPILPVNIKYIHPLQNCLTQGYRTALKSNNNQFGNLFPETNNCTDDLLNLENNRLQNTNLINSKEADRRIVLSNQQKMEEGRFSIQKSLKHILMNQLKLNSGSISQPLNGNNCFVKQVSQKCSENGIDSKTLNTILGQNVLPDINNCSCKLNKDIGVNLTDYMQFMNIYKDRIPSFYQHKSKQKSFDFNSTKENAQQPVESQRKSSHSDILLERKKEESNILQKLNSHICNKNILQNTIGISTETESQVKVKREVIMTDKEVKNNCEELSIGLENPKWHNIPQNEIEGSLKMSRLEFMSSQAKIKELEGVGQLNVSEEKACVESKASHMQKVSTDTIFINKNSFSIDDIAHSGKNQELSELCKEDIGYFSTGNKTMEKSENSMHFCNLQQNDHSLCGCKTKDDNTITDISSIDNCEPVCFSRSLKTTDELEERTRLLRNESTVNQFHVTSDNPLSAVNNDIRQSNSKPNIKVIKLSDTSLTQDDLCAMSEKLEQIKLLNDSKSMVGNNESNTPLVFIVFPMMQQVNAENILHNDTQKLLDSQTKILQSLDNLNSRLDLMFGNNFRTVSKEEEPELHKDGTNREKLETTKVLNEVPYQSTKSGNILIKKCETNECISKLHSCNSTSQTKEESSFSEEHNSDFTPKKPKIHHKSGSSKSGVLDNVEINLQANILIPGYKELQKILHQDKKLKCNQRYGLHERDQTIKRALKTKSQENVNLCKTYHGLSCSFIHKKSKSDTMIFKKRGKRCIEKSTQWSNQNLTSRHTVQTQYSYHSILLDNLSRTSMEPISERDLKKINRPFHSFELITSANDLIQQVKAVRSLFSDQNTELPKFDLSDKIGNLSNKKFRKHRNLRNSAHKISVSCTNQNDGNIATNYPSSTVKPESSVKFPRKKKFSCRTSNTSEKRTSEKMERYVGQIPSSPEEPSSNCLQPATKHDPHDNVKTSLQKTSKTRPKKFRSSNQRASELTSLKTLKGDDNLDTDSPLVKHRITTSSPIRNKDDGKVHLNYNHVPRIRMANILVADDSIQLTTEEETFHKKEHTNLKKMQRQNIDHENAMSKNLNQDKRQSLNISESKANSYRSQLLQPEHRYAMQRPTKILLSHNIVLANQRHECTEKDEVTQLEIIHTPLVDNGDNSKNVKTKKPLIPVRTTKLMKERMACRANRSCQLENKK